MSQLQPIVIIGAGPTGIGAARRLQELGEDWLVLEREDHVGGLAASFSENGYVWDIGGHVIFSHYAAYDDLLLDAVPADRWIHHDRNAQVRADDVWVPYPFQSNLDALPAELRSRCQQGLDEVSGTTADRSSFGKYIVTHFGAGIADLFMRPYNEKIWAHPLESMSVGWIAERVASATSRSQGASWGPNNRFRFPAQGGTGAIWRGAAKHLPGDRFRFGAEVERIDPDNRELTTTEGEIISYRALVSSMPVNRLVQAAGLAEEIGDVPALHHTSVHVVGLGISGGLPAAVDGVCWMYFPDATIPFYRATVFSRYSPDNAPRDRWSLLLEVSESPYRAVDAGQLVDHCTEACARAGLIHRREDVVHHWHYRAEYGYPVPTLERDRALAVTHGALEPLDIYSRGRFGAWKYEIGNMDHCYMQGREVADRIVLGSAEAVFTAAARA